MQRVPQNKDRDDACARAHTSAGRGGRRLKRSDVYAHRHAQTASAPQSQPKL